jgi:hypothetical protein
VVEPRLKFFEELKILFPQAQDAYDDATENDIEGDELLWVVIYMYVGGKIGEDFNQISSDKLQLLLDLIERGATSENEDIRIAVCTGLLESMTDPLMKDRQVWNKAQSVLGKTSLQHMLGMNKFYGIQ